MMNNLFSIFDPSTSSIFSFNWMTLSLWLLIMPVSFWISNSLFLISWKILLLKIFQEIKNNLMFKKQKNVIYLLSLFCILMFSNLLGLMPYVFTPSSHLVFTMFYAFPLWISLMIFNILNKFNKMMSHLVPLGSPILLSFFMVFIETVSNLIRPITLSIRLTANMISGHLLIHLLSSMMMMPLFFLDVYYYSNIINFSNCCCINSKFCIYNFDFSLY